MIHLRTAPACLLLAVILSSTPHVGPAACCLPEVVAAESWDANYVSKIVDYHLRIDQRGGVYFSWCGTDLDSTFAASKDDGTTWERPVVIRDTIVQVPEMEVSSDGVVVLLYLNNDFELVSLTSFDQGDSFDNPVLVAVPLGATFQHGRFIYPPQLALDDSGFLVAAWAVRSPDDQGQQDPDAGIYVSFSVDFGMSWSLAQRIAVPSTQEEHTSFPALCIGQEQEEVVISYTENPGILADGDNSRSFALRTTDRGASWSSPQPLDEGHSISLWCDSSGPGLHQVLTYNWGSTDVNPARLETLASTDGGVGWPLPPRLHGWILPLRRPHLLSTQAGRSYLAWRDTSLRRLQFTRSRQAGVNGTWMSPPTRPAPLASAPEDVWILPEEGGLFSLFYKDSPPDPNCVGVCSTMNLNRSCDEGSTWEPDFLRLDDDLEDIPRSLAPQALKAPSGRIHAAWIDTRFDNQESRLRYRALESPPHIPTDLAAEPLPPGPCEEMRYRLTASEAPPDCPDPVYRWWRNDQELTDHTTRTLETEEGLRGDHTYRVRLDCGNSPCFLSSEERTVTLTAQTGSVAGLETRGPIFVQKRDPDLRISWSDLLQGPEGYNLYRGDFRQLHRAAQYNHAGVQCHNARIPPGTADLEIFTPAVGASSYFLITPADCRSEGIPGFASDGTPRPTAGSGLECGSMP